MARFIDARIPVVFGEVPGVGDVVLGADASWDGAHASGCACCATRGPAALALDRLFLDRVRGAVPWFKRVVVSAVEEDVVRTALSVDSVVSARFRMG